MRRHILAVVAVAALAMAVPSHAEDAKTLDGDKTKKIEAKATAAPQANPDLLMTDTADRTSCTDNCLRLPFKFDPVAGASGDVVFHITWTQPGDFDLFVVDSANKVVTSCGASFGTGEIAKVPSADLKKGETYTLIGQFFMTPGDELTATVEFPGAYTPSGTVPADLDEFLLFNCGYDG